MATASEFAGIAVGTPLDLDIERDVKTTTSGDTFRFVADFGGIEGDQIKLDNCNDGAMLQGYGSQTRPLAKIVRWSVYDAPSEEWDYR